MSSDDTSGDIATQLQDAVESASSSPETQPQRTETADPSTIATAERTESAAATDEFGPLPYERHHAILEKTRRDYEDKLARLRWAEGLNPSEVDESLRLRDVYRTQPERLAERLQSRISKEPQPDVKDEHNQPYYSPQQAGKWAAWQAQQIVDAKMAELDERFGPIEERFSTQEKLYSIDASLSEARTWPGFTDDNIPAITAQVKAAADAGRKITLYEAYIRAGIPQKVADMSAARLAAEKKKWAQELNDTTERTQDAVNPNRAPSSSRRKNGEISFRDAWREELAGSK